ncbi:hypothetical protein PIB30_001455 [Stylosanthes scabra]|uniref:F-box domain-containing protein n=1 Tax=Stylosanthes scabra TaxID=79078 RepID=A0ABU6Q3H0_9FABA|nr:hypothetical protein [Stylosanthes scabra]
MEEQKQESVNEILPLELIQRILLRVPVKQLACLRCVSKLWCSLISDPHFAESHLQHSHAPTHACFFERDRGEAQAPFVRLEELFNENYFPTKAVSFPFKKNPPSGFRILGTCRGFVLLNRQTFSCCMEPTDRCRQNNILLLYRFYDSPWIWV